MPATQSPQAVQVFDIGEVVGPDIKERLIAAVTEVLSTIGNNCRIVTVEQLYSSANGRTPHATYRANEYDVRSLIKGAGYRLPGNSKEVKLSHIMIEGNTMVAFGDAVPTGSYAPEVRFLVCPLDPTSGVCV